MSSSPERSFELSIRKAARTALDIDPRSIPLTYPPTPDLGDLATPVCFELARVARRAPAELARALVEAFEPGEGIDRVEAAGRGYINAFYDRPALLRQGLAHGTSTVPAGDVSVTRRSPTKS